MRQRPSDNARRRPPSTVETRRLTLRLARCAAIAALALAPSLAPAADKPRPRSVLVSGGVVSDPRQDDSKFTREFGRSAVTGEPFSTADRPFPPMPGSRLYDTSDSSDAASVAYVEAAGELPSVAPSSEAIATPNPDTSVADVGQEPLDPLARYDTFPQPGRAAPPVVWEAKHDPDWPDLFAFFRPAEYPRFTGRGRPLIDTSWRNRPFEAGFTTGVLLGGNTLAEHVRLNDAAFIGGFHFAWDYDYYWGLEARGLWAQPEAVNLDNPHIWGWGLDKVDVGLVEAALMYYPWGDSAWRPYATIGLGTSGLEYLDDRGFGHDRTRIVLPFGGGFKYYYRDWIALRMDVIDHLVFGRKNTNTMNLITITFGMEFHFGGPRYSYFPYNPNRILR